MSKIIFWLLVVFAILFGLRLLNAAKAKKRADDARRQQAEPAPVEDTVRCSRCGVYLPKADARFGPTGLVCGDPNCRVTR